MPGFLDIEGSLTSPNIGNYYIGKGSVSTKLLGESVFTPAGNVPVFEFTAKITRLDHYSSMTGIKVKDFTAITEISGTLNMTMEEFTARNMGFALMGLASGGPSPAEETIEIFSSPVIYAAVQFVGDNDIGPIWTVNFPLVQLSPNKALGLISAGFATIDLEGDVLYDQTAKSFGTAFASLPNSPVAF
jgi:hypothetical protein